MNKKIWIDKMSDDELITFASDIYKQKLEKQYLYSKFSQSGLSNSELEYCRYVDSVLNLLDFDEKKVMVHEYFSLRSNTSYDSKWYLDYFSKQRYYKIKQQASKKLAEILKM